MLATARIYDPTMRDLEQELRDSLAQARDGNGNPQPGFLNLTRRMEAEAEDQFDVDLTILDFLVYKATGLIFEWRSSNDPYHSDLPNALVSMTAGASSCPESFETANTSWKIGGSFSSTDITEDV